LFSHAPGGQIVQATDYAGERIIWLRGVKVLLDADLAKLYGVTTARLNEQVKRNAGRFPPDFAFRITNHELTNLMSQIATSSPGHGARPSLRARTWQESWKI